MPQPPKRHSSPAQINQIRQSQREIRRSLGHWLEDHDRVQIEDRDEEEGRDPETGEIADYVASAQPKRHERLTDSASLKPEFKDWESIEGGLTRRQVREVEKGLGS